MFWTKKASPGAAPSANQASTDANKAQDYITWSDGVIKRCSALVMQIEDSSTPSSALVNLLTEIDPILQVEHEAASLRAPNDSKVSSTLLALGFALLHLLTSTKTQQEITIALKVLAKLIARPEFDILQPMSASGLYRWTPDQQKKARQYRSLLIKIHIMVVTGLAENPIVDANGSIVSVSQTLSLYPRLLAILYWRLPYVGVLIRKATTVRLPSETKLNDFSERPELPLPPPPSAAPAIPNGAKSGSAQPKRGRLRSESRAPPPMEMPIPASASSKTAAPSNTATTSQANTSRSASAGTKTAPPMAVYRPHSSSLRSAAPPAFVGSLENINSSTSTTKASTNPIDSKPSIAKTSASAPTSPRTDDEPIVIPKLNSASVSAAGDLSIGSAAPNATEAATGLQSPPVSPSSPEDLALAALKDISLSDPSPKNAEATTNEEGKEVATVSDVESPVGPQPQSPPPLSSSEQMLLNARTSSPPPPVIGQEGIATSPSAELSQVTSANPPPAAISREVSTAALKSNPKMPRRAVATNGGFATLPAGASSGKTPANFSFKVNLTPTVIELDDDLMELMVLPKVGEVPYYRNFDPQNPSGTRPYTVPWASWMKVCKKLGYFSTEGQFNAAPTVAGPNKKSGKPGSSKVSTSSDASGSSSANSSGAKGQATGLSATTSNVPPGEASILVGARSLLYNWVNFHQTLVEMGPETHPSPGSIPSPNYFVDHEPRIQWLSWFEGGNSLLFILFFKEWINHTTLMLHRTNELIGLNWESVPGYKQMEMAVKSNIHPLVASRLSMPLLDATRPLVRANPETLGWLVKYCFNQTNAHSAESVNAMFSKLEMWFGELDRNMYRIPASFDVDFFLKGLDVVISIDHHVILARLLSFIFSYAHVFRAKIRRAVIEEFFVKQHFFTLFLHWDDAVRNYYQQFLIYKTVRIRRMAHIRHGLVPPTQEALLQYNTQYGTHHAVPVNRRSVYGNVTISPGVNSNGVLVNPPGGTNSTTSTGSSSNASSASTSNNPSSVHGMTMLPFAANSFTAGVDAEGFLLDTADDEYLHDMRLFTIVESHIRIVEDQITQGGKRDLNGPESQTAYPKSLEIYAPRSLSEYNFYLSRYEQKYMCAKLIAMNIIQEKRPTAPKSSKPKNSD